MQKGGDKGNKCYKWKSCESHRLFLISLLLRASVSAATTVGECLITSLSHLKNGQTLIPLKGYSCFYVILSKCIHCESTSSLRLTLECGHQDHSSLLNTKAHLGIILTEFYQEYKDCLSSKELALG